MAKRRIVGALTLAAAAIRLYLTFTSFCISGDGAEYISMARHFAAGKTGKALASVFSPPYPLLPARAYLRKVVQDLAMSFYAFPMALGPLLFTLLAIGLWIRGRAATQMRSAACARIPDSA